MEYKGIIVEGKIKSRIYMPDGTTRLITETEEVYCGNGEYKIRKLERDCDKKIV